MTLKELRIQKKLTQKQCADLLGLSLRTYIRYETDALRQHTDRYAYMVERLERIGFIDETHGILTQEGIKAVCREIFDRYDVEYCYLFGSYAKGKATDTSDVDLFISTDLSGFAFYELVEDLREALKKKVDVLGREQLQGNLLLAYEILRDGIKIYG